MSFSLCRGSTACSPDSIPRLARHNIVPPGASEEHFFPHTDRSRRVEAVTQALEERLFGRFPRRTASVSFSTRGLPIIFAMARMDKIKNLPDWWNSLEKAPHFAKRPISS